MPGILKLGSGLGWLLVVVAGISVGAFVRFGRSEAASPVGAATVPPPAALVETATVPEGQAGLRLADLPGGTCQAWLSAYVLPPSGDLDAKVLAAGGPRHWLARGVWIGDAASAATAFGATWVASSKTNADELWIETRLDDQVMELKLFAWTTPGGQQLWSVTGSARVAPCSTDGD